MTSFTSVTPLVEIYEDNAGTPGTLHATLINPATVTQDSVNTFNAPPNTTLNASTPYWLVVSNAAQTDGTGFRIKIATLATADAGAAMGWSIGNAKYKSEITLPNWLATSSRAIFTVKGTITTTNAAPTVANAIPDQTATAGTAFSYAFLANTFADTDTGDTLAYTATKSDDTALPSWLSFAAATRTFSGTPTAADVGTVSVKVTASDGSDSVSDTFDIVVSAAPNNAPTVANAIPDRTATAGTAFSYAFPANTFNDADSDTLTYTATKSDDTALPSWLSFTAATRAFSGTPQAADVGTVSVKVTASDGNGGSVSDTFDIVVSAAANNAPVFANATASRNFTETVGDAAVSTAGNVGAVVTATDADSDTLTYSLEGTDVAKFGIVSGSGQIQTKVGEKYDLEAQASYSVTVKADDGNGGSDTIAVTITVDNAVEKPVAPAMPTVTATSGSTTSLDVSWTAPANAGRPAITGYKVEYRPGVSGSWLTHAHAGTGTTATIAGLTAATSYQVQVLAVNSDGDGAWSGPGSGTTGTPTNNAPVFATDTASRSFTETVRDAAVEGVGENVGAGGTATDADGDTLGYSLDGTDEAKFGIVSGSGQIQTKVGEKYDREAQASYSVTVKADDGNGGSDTILVTITVDNAAEKPVAPAMPTVTATSGSTTSLDVSWTAPANTGRPAITGYKVEYRPGVSGSWLTHAHAGTGTTATIASLTAATGYQVQVLAVNADGDGAWSGPGAGTTNMAGNANPTFTDGTSTTRAFTETVGDAAVSTAGNVGAVVTATDTDTGGHAHLQPGRHGRGEVRHRLQQRADPDEGG